MFLKINLLFDSKKELLLIKSPNIKNSQNNADKKYWRSVIISRLSYNINTVSAHNKFADNIMAVSAIDKRWTYYTFTQSLRLPWILQWLTTRNLDPLESKEFELVGVNLKDLLIFVALSHELTTGHAGLLTLSTLLLLELTDIQCIEQLWMFLQLSKTIGGTGDESACDGPDVVQTKDLREKQEA